MLASPYWRPTYLKASTNIRQLWQKWFRHASYTCIEHFIKLVNSIQLACTHLFENNNILEDNPSDEILFSILLEQYLTTKPPNTPLAALPELVMIANINRLVCKAYVISKPTRMTGHKPITPITRPLKKGHSDL